MAEGSTREINYLRISVTDRCNLRCLYCMPKEGVSFLGHEDILRYEEILRIVAIAVRTGVLKARVTGGEPLARKGIVDFLRRLHEMNGLHDISLTTNGTLLEACAEPLRDAGLKRINISLDSLVAEKYHTITRGGNLDAVMRGIAAAERAGFSPVKINVVAIRGFNDDEILDFARLTLDHRFQVRFIEFMPIGNVSLAEGFTYYPNDEIKKKIETLRPLAAAPPNSLNTNGPARIYRMEGAAGEIGLISAMSHRFCDSCNRLRLTADGHLRTCLLSDDELDLKKVIRNGCSDGDLEAAIRGAISEKHRNTLSDRHEMARKNCARGMSAIGG
ncbi:MAG: GTP 3',8-cyclase MoaA [Deltaproteobacteria bacterium]|nr:GTP 3',8-cyclase MoaA [Deltaproteobacteria bacterium]